MVQSKPGDVVTSKEPNDNIIGNGGENDAIINDEKNKTPQNAQVSLDKPADTLNSTNPEETSLSKEDI